MREYDHEWRVRVHASTHQIQPEHFEAAPVTVRQELHAGDSPRLDQPFSRLWHDSSRVVVWLNRTHCVGIQPPCSSERAWPRTSPACTGGRQQAVSYDVMAQEQRSPEQPVMCQMASCFGRHCKNRHRAIPR